jgi:hypothetical protein
MAVVNLNKKPDGFDAGLDSVIIVSYLEGIPGGRALDVTEFPDSAISAGHVVIKETATGDYKPMPVNGNEYGALPGGHTIEGVTVSTVTKDEASVGIMVRGSVNAVASRYPVTQAIKNALPLIRFTQD